MLKEWNNILKSIERLEKKVEQLSDHVSTGKGIVKVLVVLGSLAAACIGYQHKIGNQMTMIREPGDWQEDWCNFKPDEFRCSCCNRLEIASELIRCTYKKLEIALGPLTITSAYRCPDHNSKVSSTGLSGPHTTGFAVIYMSLTLNIENN